MARLIRPSSIAAALLGAALALAPSPGTAAGAPGVAATRPTAGVEGPGAVRVAIDGASVRVEVRAASPVEVLRILGRLSGVPVTVEGALPGNITRAFGADSLEEAVREVVRGYSAALVFGHAEQDRGGRPSDIRIIALGNAPPVPEPSTPGPPEPGVRPEAVRAGPAPAPVDSAPDPTRALLEDGDPVARARAAAALGEPGAPPSARSLLAALSDPSPMVRTQAIRALGRADPEAAAPDLRAILAGDPDPEVRRAAARALERLAGPEAPTPSGAAGGPDTPLGREAVEAFVQALRSRP